MLDRAIQIATASGARPELARTHLERARLRAERGDDRRDDRGALADASTAVELAAALGMKPLARQARSLARSRSARNP